MEGYRFCSSSNSANTQNHGSAPNLFELHLRKIRGEATIHDTSRIIVIPSHFRFAVSERKSKPFEEAFGINASVLRQVFGIGFQLNEIN